MDNKNELVHIANTKQRALLSECTLARPRGRASFLGLRNQITGSSSFFKNSKVLTTKSRESWRIDWPILCNKALLPPILENLTSPFLRIAVTHSPRQKANDCSHPEILVSHICRSDSVGTADRKNHPDH